MANKVKVELTEEQVSLLGDLIDFARESADAASWGEVFGRFEDTSDEDAEAAVSALEAALATA